MEDLNFPICILKLNLHCCKDLPSRVKKRLRKVKGVYAITVDPEKGLVLISGTAEPPVLIAAVEKLGERPQLYAYERDATKAKTRFRSLLKRYAAVKTREEPPPTTSAAEKGREEPPLTSAAGACPAVGGEVVRGPMMMIPPPMQMPMFTLPPRMGPPGWLAPGTRPMQLVTYEQPKVTARKSPAPYPFDFYESTVPASNSLFNYFSDDHAQPCIIM